MNGSTPTGRHGRPKPELRVDTLTLLQRTRATSANISALDLVFDHEDYFNYNSPSQLELPERPYRCPSPDLGQAKAGFKFSLRSLSFKERGTSIPKDSEHKEKKWGLATKVGGLLSTISRRSPAVPKDNQCCESRL